MASPNTLYGDLLATTINAYSKDAADNLSKNSPFLDLLRKKGNIKSGGVQLTETIMYASAGNVKRYSGFDTIDVGVNNSHSMAAYDWKQYASPVAISGLEMTQTSGSKQAILDLVGQRVEASTAGLKNLISDDLFSAGTADGGKQIGGLQLLVADSPTSGTVGGIDRSANVFWQNVSFDATTNGGAATTATNIAGYMSRVMQRISRNSKSADIILLDDYYYSLFDQYMMSIQRLPDGGGTAEAGFQSYLFKGAKVYNAGGFQGPDSTPFDGTVAGGIPYQHAYFLNSDTLKLRTAERRNFTTIGEGKRISTNQDAEVQLIGWTGALTMNCAFVNAVMVE